MNGPSLRVYKDHLVLVRLTNETPDPDNMPLTLWMEKYFSLSTQEGLDSGHYSVVGEIPESLSQTSDLRLANPEKWLRYEGTFADVVEL